MSRALSTMRARSTRPSRPQPHWMFHVMSFMEGDYAARGIAAAMTKPASFTIEQEAEFRAQRVEALARVNGETFWMVALLVVAFSGWDYFVDPEGWGPAFVIR